MSLNLPQFNILPRIALFVCNIGPFSLVPNAKADHRSREFKIGMPSECATDTTKIAPDVRHIARDTNAVEQTLREREFKKLESSNKNTRGQLQKSQFSTTSEDVRDEL